MNDKKRLADLRIDRVALVARGSNPHADIVFYKAHPDDKETETMGKKIQKIDRKKLAKEDATALEAILKKAGVEETDEEEKELTAEELIASNAAVKKVLDDALAAQKKAETDLAAAVKKAKKAKDAKDEDDEDEDTETVIKGLDPKVRELITKAQAAADAAKTAAEAAEKRAKDAEAASLIEKSIREESDFARTFEPFVKNYPGKNDDNARLMHRIKKALEANGSKDDFAKLETVIKAGNVALDTLTKVTGEDGATSFGKAYDQLKDKADALLAADTTGKLTFAKAFGRVSDQHPELVAEYRKEKKQAEREDRTH